MNSNEMQLSLNGNTFEALKEDFDSILASTVGTMEMKCADNATITLKLDIVLDKTSGFTKPTFSHNLSSVMQVKQKKSGSLSGEYALVWDEEEQRHVLRKIKGDQLNMFEGDIIDVECSPAGPIMIESGETPEEAIKKMSFDYMKRFVGKKLKVVPEGEGYVVVSVEDDEYKDVVLLSSLISPDNDNYCNAETLAAHIGHSLYCTGYAEESDEDGLREIFIECENCEETIFSITRNQSGAEEDVEEDVEEDSEDDVEVSEDDSSETDDYEYDAPEEE